MAPFFWARLDRAPKIKLPTTLGKQERKPSRANACRCHLHRVLLSVKKTPAPERRSCITEFSRVAQMVLPIVSADPRTSERATRCASILGGAEGKSNRAGQTINSGSGQDL